MSATYAYSDGNSLDAPDGFPKEAVYVDNNGKVGIGTTTPERKLHVVGGNPRILIEDNTKRTKKVADETFLFEGGNPEVNFRSKGSQDWAIYKDGSSGGLKFYQGGDKVIIHNKTGNVDFMGNISAGGTVQGLKVLGCGRVHMSGSGSVITKPINFIAGWNTDKIIAIGNVFYPGGIGKWGHWLVGFKSINGKNGTAKVYIDSGGGWSGTVGAEWVSYIVYGF